MPGFYPFLFFANDLDFVAAVSGNLVTTSNFALQESIIATGSSKVYSGIRYFYTGNAPPPFVASDIQFLHSGGVYNNDASKSIGGDESISEVLDGTNNLFQAIDKDSVYDYRCIYIRNNNSECNFANVRLYLSQIQDTGALAKVGIPIANEVQQIILTGDPIGGSFSLTYTREINGTDFDQNTWDIEWIPTLSVMQERISDALNALTFLSSVSCVASHPNASTYVYVITFSGSDGNRTHQLLSLGDNNMLEEVEFSFSSLVRGQPINGTAANVGYSSQEPSGVSFVNPETLVDAIEIGDLYPGDSFPVWFKRSITAAELTELTDPSVIDIIDGVRIKIKGRAQFVSIME